MKPALIFFSVVTSLSLWFTVQETQPVISRGKPLSITMLTLPGPKMTGPSVPLRFGGTRPLPTFGFQSESGFRLVIRNRDEFSDFWKRFTAHIPPANGIPPLPEIDFSKEMLVIAAMGQRPSSGFWTIIDGACEVDGQVEVFVSNVENVNCIGGFSVLTFPADAVLLPKSDLPVVFRETQVDCRQWYKQFRYL